MASMTTPVQSRRGAPQVAAHLAPLHRATASAAAAELSVTLHRRTGGVILEREERSSVGWRIAVVTAFTRPSAFEDWCADDPLRFEQPIVHQQVRRRAAELWSSGS